MVAPVIETLPQRIPQSVSSPGGALPRRMPLLSPNPGDRLIGATTGIQVELGERIGDGGYADVFKSRDGRYAVKFLKPKSNDSPDIATPEREVAMQARVNSDNVLPVVAVDSEEGRYRPYIIMPLAEGGDLKEYIQSGPIPPREGLNIIVEAVRAIMDLHEAGLVHRDVKPRNFLLTPTGIKLTDFGIATKQGAKLAKNRDKIASPEYVAPERLWGERDTPSSDIYGLGLIAYEVLTGELPYSLVGNNRRKAAVYAHFHQQPRPFSEVLGDRMTPLHKELEPVIRKALAKDPKRRFRSAKAFLDSLEEARKKASISSEKLRPGRHRERERKFFHWLRRGKHRADADDTEANRKRHLFNVRRKKPFVPRHEKTISLNGKTEAFPREPEERTQRLEASHNTVALDVDSVRTQPVAREPEEKTQRIRLRGLRGLLQREQAPTEERIVTIYPPSEITTRPIDLRTGSLDSFEELRAFFDRRDVNGKKIKNPKGHPKSWGFLGRKHYDPQGRRMQIRTRIAAGGLSAAAVGTLASTWEAGMSALRVGLNFLGL